MEQEKIDMDKLEEIIAKFGINYFADPRCGGNVFEVLGARPYNPDGTPVKK